ncbi:MAG: hypothetical protein AAGH72_13035 [Verrucomicrobiota bacterium]
MHESLIRCSRRGSTLLLVLVFLFIISTTTMALIQVVNEYLDHKMSRYAGFRSFELALSGLAFGMEPDLPPDDERLRQNISDQERFEVSFESENRRISINALLLGENQEPLERLLREWGLNAQEASTLIDRLMDWVDTDSLKKLNGAEEIDYLAQGRQGQPRNAAFLSVDEMNSVLGMERLNELRPDWQEYFTTAVNSPLDLMEADPTVLSAFLDISLEKATDFSDYRTGSDGILKTEDDPEFESIQEVLGYLGVTQVPEAALNQLTIQATHRRIRSTGYAGTSQHIIEIVVPAGSEIQRQNIVWIKL